MLVCASCGHENSEGAKFWLRVMNELRKLDKVARMLTGKVYQLNVLADIVTNRLPAGVRQGRRPPSSSGAC